MLDTFKTSGQEIKEGRDIVEKDKLNITGGMREMERWNKGVSGEKTSKWRENSKMGECLLREKS